MRKKKSVVSATTFIDSDARIEGVIEFTGNIHIDGRVKGRITSVAGTVIVGAGAIIEADIIVDNAIIKGDVTGRIEASGMVVVSPPGKVDGDIIASEISIDTGVVFNGRCIMNTPFTPNSGKIRSEKIPPPKAGKDSPPIDNLNNKTISEIG